MRQIVIFSFGCLMILGSCALKILTSISKKYSPIDNREEQSVFGIQDPIPDNSEEIGVIKIGDTGFTGNCGSNR